jgi:malonyl CoA-acyl carrier protein transacylase
MPQPERSPEIYRRVDQGVQEIEPTLKTQILFYGQGRNMKEVCGQIVALGEHPVAKRRIDLVDEILHDLYPDEFPEGISSIILHGSEEELKQYQQPIIFVNDTASLDVFRQQYPDINIVGIAGYSFGTVTAAHASGAIRDDENALRFIMERSRIVAQANKENPGKLTGLAVNNSDEKLADLHREFGTETSIKTSNRFTVIGGDIESVDQATEKAQSQGIKIYSVDYNDAAYHTSLLSSAVPRLEEVLRTIEMQDPHSTMTSNNAKTINRAGQAQKELATHIANMSDWQRTARSIATRRSTEQLIEIGNPNGNLSSHLERDLQDQYPTINRRDLKKTILSVGIGVAGATGLAIGAYLGLRAIRNRQ